MECVGARVEVIRKAEQRELFKQAMLEIGLDVPESSLAGSPQDMSGGSITIATVDSTHVTGSVDMTFANGSVFQRSFDATVCAVTPPLDVCALLSPLGCIAPACVP